MKLDVIELCELTAATRDALVCASPDGWVFGLDVWDRVIRAVDAWGLVDRGFALTSKAGVVAVVPLHHRAATRTTSSTGWGGCGPMLAGELDPQSRLQVYGHALEEALRRARSDGAAAFEVSLSPVTRTSLGSPWGVSPFERLGYPDASRVAQVIDLDTDEDALWQAISPKVRREMQKAQDAGLTSCEVPWKESLDNYYRLHVQTYERTGASPHPRRYFEGIAHDLSPLGHARLFACLASDGEVLAYHNAACFGDAGFYHTGCSAPAGRSLPAGHLAFWEAMTSLRRSGVRWYDCGTVNAGAADAKLAGLSFFKTRFGGELHRQFACRVELSEGEGQLLRQEPAESGASWTFMGPLRRRAAAAISRWRR